MTTLYTRPEGFACGDSSQCASPLSCLQGDWPVTTCGLAPGGISGTIRLNGAGIENVWVSAEAAGGGIGNGAPSDSSGNYSIAGMANGDYIVRPSFEGYSFDPPQATVTVQDAMVTGVDFTAALIPLYTLSGTITLGGVALPNINVSVSGSQYIPAMTNSSGQFSVQVPNGDYIVSAYSADYSFNPQSVLVTVQGADETGVNFAASVVYSISGTAGTPGVTLTLSGDASTTASSGRGGEYQFRGLTNGSYRITPTLAGYSFEPAFRDVVVNGSNITGQDFTATLLNPTYNISGYAGMSGVRLTLSGDASTNTISGKGGTYQFYGLNNGSYRVTPTLTGYTFDPEFLDVLVNGSSMTDQNFTPISQ
jgi:hypothetical protein